ncbi:hypothetical protein CYPRO_3180 [Cyclonatronum proteinivorum]|uniref:Uncharacterized protein n=1 Tax=Cyclonatronum proteinivorum TaxID=1457365 RepID=A0A345UPL2_9BACT|nr:hypothetical protein CYPRO_3180 [Cyclonatronum proteinivorum]
MKSDKAFCKYDKKYIRENLSFFAELAAKPAYICRKCARASSQKNTLCRPVKLDKIEVS